MASAAFRSCVVRPMMNGALRGPGIVWPPAARPDEVSGYPLRMATAPLRKDAARNWQRIVEVGRRLVDDGVPLQLNDVARLAGVGVATVYRHFATPEALLETVAAPGLEALAAHGERALADGDPWQALTSFLFAAIDMMLTDSSISAVTATRDNTLPRTAELKARLQALCGQLLAGAHAAARHSGPRPLNQAAAGGHAADRPGVLPAQRVP
jgi:AcrR family transcriptional regulator